MNDDKLLKIAVEIDDFLTRLITKYELDALVWVTLVSIVFVILVELVVR